jgi:hypothetical protein
MAGLYVQRCADRQSGRGVGIVPASVAAARMAQSDPFQW